MISSNEIWNLSLLSLFIPKTFCLQCYTYFFMLNYHQDKWKSKWNSLVLMRTHKKKYISDSYNIAMNWCWKVKFLIFTVHIIFSTYYLPRFQKYIYLRDITLITVSFYIFTSSNCIKIISFNFFLFTNFRITQILIESLIIFKSI